MAKNQRRKRRKTVKTRLPKVMSTARAANTHPVRLQPGYPEPQDVPVLLRRAASALNDLEAAGVRVRLGHGAIITEWGYAFRVGAMPAPWEVRSRRLLAIGDDDRDEDDL